MAEGKLIDPALSYRYRWVASADRDAVAAVALLVETVSRDQPFVGLPVRPSREDSLLFQNDLLHGLASGRLSLLTAEHDSDGVIACVALRRPATANQHHLGELTTGAVHPKHRGRGLVAAVFAEIARRCAETGIEVLLLDVRAGIKAELVWRSYGFEEYGRLADYGRADGESYPGVFLAQPVAQLRERILTKGGSPC